MLENSVTCNEWHRYVELKILEMKKYILGFAVAAMTFTSMLSCKNEGEGEGIDEVEPVEELQQTEESMSDKTSNELEDTELVPSGTYTGEAIVVDAQQKEIYVKLNDTTTIELYFSNDTQIMRDGQKVNFEALQEGQTLEVEVEKSGESLKPLSVRIVGNQ